MPANVEAPATKPRKPWLIALIILVCLALAAGIIAIVTGNADKNPAPKRAAVGDIITLGTFEQDDNRANGPEPIQWRVLAREGDRILVVSVYGLDRQLYDADEWNYDLWETCDLKAWLEDDFMQTAFTAEDRAAILEITCLSIEEATTLFADDEDRICQATPYAKSQGVWNGDDWGHTGKGCFWWMRSPGDDGVNDATYVTPYGELYTDGSGSWDPRVAVRPALWLSIG